MKLKVCLFLLCFVAMSRDMSAQPINDECRQAIFLPDVKDFCSGSNAFSTKNATPSFNGISQCNPSGGPDVWFTFFVTASDVVIKIIPDDIQPVDATLYSGKCSGLSEEVCGSISSGESVLQLYKGGLIPGTRLFLRVSDMQAAGFDFTVCINNFFAPVLDGSDCSTANLICSKHSFAVKNVTGFGKVNELQDAPCFSNTVESNSIWFRWICDDPGTFTFSLNPLKVSDDLDFVLYKVNGDPMGCNLELIRCMATGISPGNCPNFPNCCGPTGLMEGEADVSESAGCSPEKNNFLAPIDMQSGEAYALLVNNYTSQNQGFDFVMGGTATLRGIKADLNIQPNQGVCLGDEIIVHESIDNPVGNATDIKWYFGPDARPPAAVGNGPQTVTFNHSGTKVVSVIVTDTAGCKAFVQDTLHIDCCGGTLSVDIGSDTIVALGSQPDINVNYNLEGEMVTYKWTPAVKVTCDSCVKPGILPVSGDFFLHLELNDENGCRAGDGILIKAKDPDFFFPNIFSPNEDGINDYFFPDLSLLVSRVVEMKVYNRWGAQVFSGNNLDPAFPNQGWDGTFRGKTASSGVYVYYAVLEVKGVGNIKVKGNVTLVR